MSLVSPASPASPVALSPPMLMVSPLQKAAKGTQRVFGGCHTRVCARVGVRGGAAWVAVAAVCVSVCAHGGGVCTRGVCVWVCLCTRGVCACHVALAGPSSLPPGEVSRAAGGGAGRACACKGVHARVCTALCADGGAHPCPCLLAQTRTACIPACTPHAHARAPTPPRCALARSPPPPPRGSDGGGAAPAEPPLPGCGPPAIGCSPPKPSGFRQPWL